MRTKILGLALAWVSGLSLCTFGGGGVGFAAADPVADVVAEVVRREQQIAAALGPYKFYVYEGGAFDAISTDLLKTVKSAPAFNEYRAPVWVHRALLADPHRTLDPLEADAFFVPAYLQISKEASHTAGKGRQVKNTLNTRRDVRRLEKEEEEIFFGGDAQYAAVHEGGPITRTQNLHPSVSKQTTNKQLFAGVAARARRAHRSLDKSPQGEPLVPALGRQRPRLRVWRSQPGLGCRRGDAPGVAVAARAHV